MFLRGARQTGKTTLVKALARQGHPATYITLDDLGILAACRADPQGFLRVCPVRWSWTRCSTAPDLFLAIKTEIDGDRTPGRFLLTSSAGPELLAALARPQPQARPSRCSEEHPPASRPARRHRHRAPRQISRSATAPTAWTGCG